MPLHSTLSDRYLRALPFLGLYFLWGQAQRLIFVAKHDDRVFVETMQSLEADYRPELDNHKLLLSYILVSGSLLTIVIAWWLSYAIFSNHHFLVASFCALCNAIWFDYLIGKSLLILFNRFYQRGDT